MSQARTNPEIFPNEPEGAMIPPDDSVQFPVKIGKSESDRIASAQRLNKSLLNEFDALQGYVILKNAEAIIKIGLEAMKDGAIGQLSTKEETVMGVKVTQRRSVEYEYSHPRLKEIEEQIKTLKDEEKKLKTLTQSMTEPMAYGTSGEMVEPAKLIKDGVTIAVTLPK